MIETGISRRRFSRNTLYGIAVLCVAIALLAGIASGLGVFARGDGTYASTVTIRGEHYRYATTGIYRFNSERLVAEGVGWDIVTLFLAVPAMLVTAGFLARGSLRARLAAAGLLGYFFYQFVMYALMDAFGPLFLVYVALYSASLVGIGWIISTIPLAELPSAFDERFPRRGMATFAFAMAALLVMMWMRLILGGLGGQIQGLLLGMPAPVVQALDLGLIVPFSVFVGVMVLRRRPLGYLLAPILAVKGVTMATAIAAMLLSAWAVEGHLEVVPFAIFVTAAVAAGWLGVRMLLSVRLEAEAAPQPSTELLVGSAPTAPVQG